MAALTRAVVKVIDSAKSQKKLLYPDDMPLLEKIRTVAKEIYCARDIEAPKTVRDQLVDTLRDSHPAPPPRCERDHPLNAIIGRGHALGANCIPQ